MKKVVLFIGLIVFTIVTAFYAKRTIYDIAAGSQDIRTTDEQFVGQEEFEEGDLIFQTSLSAQSKAIQLATKSRYSHCGIIFKDKNAYYVLEAVQPVKRTPMQEWIARGKDGKYVTKRLKNSDQVLTDTALHKMKQVSEQFMGKDYDLTFEWSDDKMYCSELIWKIYQLATGIEIGNLEKLSDFDLKHEAVAQKLKERYGDTIPLGAIVISPASIFNSKLLTTVKANLESPYLTLFFPLREKARS